MGLGAVDDLLPAIRTVVRMSSLRRSSVALLVFALALTTAFVVGPTAPTGTAHAQTVEQKFATSLEGSCAATTDGEVWCWGSRFGGAVGDGTGEGFFEGLPYLAPAKATTAGAVEVSNGACARTAAGVVRCWGGAGTTDVDGEYSRATAPWGTTTPQQFGFGVATKIAGRCALLVDATVQCQGWNGWGELGNGALGWRKSGSPPGGPGPFGGTYAMGAEFSSATAVGVVGLTDVVDISSQRGTTCAVRNDGSAWCWGIHSSGSLGDGGPASEIYPGPVLSFPDLRYSSVPVQVVGVTDAVSIGGTCVIRTGGKVSCWGSNSYGAISLTGSTGVLTATEVPWLQGATDVAVLGSYSMEAVCGVMADASIRCQGKGRMGDGLNRSVPASITIPNVGPAAEISGTCIRFVDKSISCWGYNRNGELGIGYASPGSYLQNFVNAPKPVIGFSEPAPVGNLDVKVTVAPAAIQLDKDNDGNGTIDDLDNQFTVTVEVTNNGADDIADVVFVTPADPLQFSNRFKEHLTLDYELVGAFEQKEFGDLAVGASASVSYTFRATDIVWAGVGATVVGNFLGSPLVGTSPPHNKPATPGATTAQPEIRAFTTKVLEAKISQPMQVYEAGKLVRVSGTFKNVSDETDDPQAVSFGAFPTLEGNAGNGNFGLPGARTPTGPSLFVLAPGEEIELNSILLTTEAAVATEGRVSYLVEASLKNEEDVWEKVGEDTIHTLEEQGFSATQVATLPPTPPIDDGAADCSTDLLFTFYVACRLGAGVITAAKSIGNLVVFVGSGILTLGEAELGIMRWTVWMLRQYIGVLTLDPVARAAFVQELSVQLETLKNLGHLGLQGVQVTAAAIAPAVGNALRDIERVLETGDIKLIVGGLAEFLGENIDMVFEALVGARALKTALASATADGATRQALQTALQKQTDELAGKVATHNASTSARNLPTSGILKAGNNVLDMPSVWREAYGARAEDVANLLKIARDEGVVIAFRSRAPRAAELIDNLLAYVKPGSVPLKGVNDIDREFLGYLDEWDAKTYLVEPPVKYLDKGPARDAAIEAFLDANPRLVGGTEFTRNLRSAVKARLETRMDEWPVNVKKFKQYKDHGIDVNFYEGKQGLQDGVLPTEAARDARITRVDLPALAGDPGRPIARRAFRLEMRGPFGGAFKDITGDIDIMAIVGLDGKVLTDLVKRADIYQKLRALVGMQHGESLTYIGQAAREKWLSCCAGKVGDETLLAATPNNELMTTFFDDSLSTLQGSNNTSLLKSGSPGSAFFPGATSQAQSAVRPSLGLSLNDLFDSLALEYSITSPFAVANLARAVEELEEVSVKPGHDRSGRAVRPDGNGGAEEYVESTTSRRLTRAAALTDGPTSDELDAIEAELAAAGFAPTLLPGKLGGEWVPVSASELTARGPLGVVPFTFTYESSAAGALGVDVLTRAEMGVAASSSYFAVGDRVIVDPGGPREEVATIASVSPMRFTAPLQNEHLPATMVLFAPILLDSSEVVSLDPARFVETRSGADLTTIDGSMQATGPIPARSFIAVQVSGRGEVPATGVGAVVMNVTAVGPQGYGFVTAYPCGVKPLASSLNYSPGAIVGNEVIAKLDSTGKVCLYSEATTDLVVDVVGYAPVSSLYTPISPARFLETRSGAEFKTVDGQSRAIGAISGRSFVELQVAGRGVVPASGVGAVVMNVTAVGPQGNGFVTAFPCGTMPLASSLNYSPGAVVGNEIVAKLDARGKVCLYSEATSDLVVDVTGFVPSASSYVSLDPIRLLETRSVLDSKTVDGLFSGTGRIGARQMVVLQMAGRSTVPASGVGAVVMNVTAVGPQGNGFVTAFPCGTMPLASSLNYSPGVIVGNEVIAKLDPTGKVCLYSEAATDLVVDVTGYVPIS